MSFANFDRCRSENSRFKEVIDTNPERACNVAIFLGELLMNYKVCIKLVAFILTHARKTHAFSTHFPITRIKYPTFVQPGPY